MQAGLDRADSENSDLVAWTEQMRASCFISDAPCRALSDVVQHKKPGEEERGALGPSEVLLLLLLLMLLLLLPPPCFPTACSMLSSSCDMRENGKSAISREMRL